MHKHISHNVVDPDDSFTELMSQVIPKSISQSIHACTIGKVTSYDTKRHECEVQILPLELDSDDKVAVLNAVLVPESIWKFDQLLARQSALLSALQKAQKAQADFNKTVADKLSALKDASKVDPPTEHKLEKETDKQLFGKLLKVGSVVSVGFFDRELDNYQNNNNNYKTESDRSHSLNDAFLIGVIKS